MSSQEKMNLVLVTLDSLRVDHLGCYGCESAETPNIDSEASRGIVFEQAITNGSYTKTAFPPILSSTYASGYGGPFSDVGSRRPMLAEVLKKNGYSTAGFTANPLLGSNQAYDKGFDRFEEPSPPPLNRPWLKLRGAQRVLRSATLNTLLRGFVETRPDAVFADGESVTRLASDWLLEQRGPFFLWVHYMDAHWPYHDHKQLLSGGDSAQAWQDLHVMWKHRKAYPGTEVVRRIMSLYRSAISRLDKQVGLLLRQLDELDLRSETIIAIASDHGEAFYEHGRWQHGAYVDFHEEILRVPLIMEIPGCGQGHRISRQVCLLDLGPTILEALSLQTPDTMEGTSLLPAALEPVDGDSTVITEMFDLDYFGLSIRTEQYKYIYDERFPERRFLYDLEEDPSESVNRIGEHPEVEAFLEEVLCSHIARIKGPSSRSPYGAWEHDRDVIRRLQALGYLEE